MPEQKTYYRRHLPHYQPEGETFHVVFRLAGSIAVSVLDEFRRELRRKDGPREDSARLRFLRRYRRRYLERIEAMLDGGTRGPHWLNKPGIAAIVDEAIHFWDGEKFVLIAECIMPNHVHLVLRLLPVGRGRRDGVPSDKEDFGPAADLDSAAAAEAVRRISCPQEKTLSVGSLIRRQGGRDSVPSERPLTDILASIKKYTALRANRVLGRTGSFWHPESYDHVIRNGAELERTIRYVLYNPINAGFCRDWRDWKWTYVKAGYVPG